MSVIGRAPPGSWPVYLIAKVPLVFGLRRLRVVSIPLPPSSLRHRAPSGSRWATGRCVRTKTLGGGVQRYNGCSTVSGGTENASVSWNRVT